MGAGAHLCTAHPVLVFSSNVSAESTGMSGAGFFMLPEVGPAKCLCYSCTLLPCRFCFSLCVGVVGLCSQGAAVLPFVLVHLESSFGLCAALDWVSPPACVLLSICWFADGRTILEHASGCLLLLLLLLLLLFCVCVNMSLKVAHFLAANAPSSRGIS